MTTSVRAAFIPTLAAILPTPSLIAQGLADPSVAAVFKLGDREGQIAKVDLALELARRERLRAHGQAALDHLVLKTLVRNAAARAGIEVSKSEIRERIDFLEERLEARDLTLQQFLAAKNIGWEAFERDYVGLSIAHEKLVRHSAGLGPDSEVTEELLNLWLEEARSETGVELDPEKLGAGIVARIGDRQLTLADLGAVLVENATIEDRDKAIRQIVVRKLLDFAAKEHGIEVSADDIEAEIGVRRRMIESDPRYGGVPIEQLLKSQGTSIEELRRSPVIRAQVQRDRLATILFDDASLAAELEKNREAVIFEHGAQRQVYAILIRATEVPNQFVERDFEAALEQAHAVRQRIADGMAFQTAAKIHSDDARSKVDGGKLGMLGRSSDALPREALDAAFAIDPFLVTQPVRTARGYYLLMVAKVEPTPADDALRGRMRQAKMQRHVHDMLEAAEIKTR